MTNSTLKSSYVDSFCSAQNKTFFLDIYNYNNQGSNNSLNHNYYEVKSNFTNSTNNVNLVCKAPMEIVHRCSAPYSQDIDKNIIAFNCNKTTYSVDNDGSFVKHDDASGIVLFSAFTASVALVSSGLYYISQNSLPISYAIPHTIAAVAFQYYLIAYSNDYLSDYSLYNLKDTVVSQFSKVSETPTSDNTSVELMNDYTADTSQSSDTFVSEAGFFGLTLAAIGAVVIGGFAMNAPTLASGVYSEI